jgi:polyhydroxyalkanoate synthase subunit PhaC
VSVNTSGETLVRAPTQEPGKQEPVKPQPAKSPPVKIGSIDVEAFSHNLARLIEEGGRALAAYLKPREQGRTSEEFADEVTEVVKTLGHVAEYWLADPQRTVELQNRLGKAYLELWASTAKRLAGEDIAPVAVPAKSDKRFADPEWTQNQFFDFLKQAYLLTAHWADALVSDAKELDPHTRQKAEFYIRQIVNALSPTNFVLTNPELLRETFTSNADNLVRGMHMLAEDIERGGGELKIRQSDGSMFEVGRNLAITPGKVIYQNELMQLIQYAPSTETVLKRPLLIVPPWINKFYVLDLTPEKSFIKWCVDRGLTVFCISWVNPDSHLAQKSFEDYVQQGPLAALDAIKEAIGEDKVHTVGYCVGGTLLAATLAQMTVKGDERIVSATLFAAQVDFTYAGDLKVFVDEEQVAALERRMAERGYLDSGSMATVFNLLRSNDLLWPYVINNYLKGKAPFPFDLLYWNSDATRMPAANHSFYLRNCYLNNTLAKGKVTLDGTPINLRKIKVPVYNLATREDHIAPAKSVMYGSRLFGGEVRFVLSGSGHIAGVINPPDKKKYQFWTGPRPRNADVEGWLSHAKENPGSWWPDWLVWLTRQSPTEVPARIPGSGALKAIEDAPGSYVKVRD